MADANLLRLCEYDTHFLDMSYQWLCDEEINRLTDTGPVTKQQQQAWFKTLPNRTDYFVWGVVYDERPIGVCGIKHITNEGGEYFGYIGEKQYWGMGLGKQMMALLEQEAVRMCLPSLHLHVLQDNARAIRLYLKMGYNVVSKESGLWLMQKTLNHNMV